MDKLYVYGFNLKVERFTDEYAPSDRREEVKITGSMREFSDGYHTITELYEQRHALFIALCRSESYWFKTGHSNIAEIPGINPVWRSKKHSDGTSWDGWFILGIGREKGKQKTFHLPMSKWEITNFAETLDKAPEFDGHTSKDVISRLERL